MFVAPLFTSKTSSNNVEKIYKLAITNKETHLVMATIGALPRAHQIEALKPYSSQFCYYDYAVALLLMLSRDTSYVLINKLVIMCGRAGPHLLQTVKGALENLKKQGVPMPVYPGDADRLLVSVGITKESGFQSTPNVTMIGKFNANLQMESAILNGDFALLQRILNNTPPSEYALNVACQYGILRAIPIIMWSSQELLVPAPCDEIAFEHWFKSLTPNQQATIYEQISLQWG